MDCGGFIKIGVSNNPNRRKEQLPYKVKQYYCTDLKENAFEIEKRMHSIFCSKRNHEAPGREYFDVQFNEAVKILMDITIIPTSYLFMAILIALLSFLFLRLTFLCGVKVFFSSGIYFQQNFSSLTSSKEIPTHDS